VTSNHLYVLGVHSHIPTVETMVVYRLWLAICGSQFVTGLVYQHRWTSRRRIIQTLV